MDPELVPHQQDPPDTESLTKGRRFLTPELHFITTVDQNKLDATNRRDIRVHARRIAYRQASNHNAPQAQSRRIDHGQQYPITSFTSHFKLASWKRAKRKKIKPNVYQILSNQEDDRDLSDSNFKFLEIPKSAGSLNVLPIPMTVESERILHFCRFPHIFVFPFPFSLFSFLFFFGFEPVLVSQLASLSLLEPQNDLSHWS